MSTDQQAAGLDALLELSPRTLETLAAALREGALQHSITRGLLESTAGTEAARAYPALAAAVASGCPPRVAADICEVLAKAREAAAIAKDGTDLVLSGPDIPGVHVVDTATVARNLFHEAKRDVLICSYVIYLDKAFFAELAHRHDQEPDLQVRLIVDVSHNRKDELEPSAIAANRFRHRFLEQCWAGTKAPAIFHDPRGFGAASESRGVMHAKVIVVDDSAALVTSANFTAAAQERNIEAGVLFRNRHQVRRLRQYFEGLIARQHLVRIG